jgi:hypothetical protein
MLQLIVNRSRRQSMHFTVVDAALQV